MISEEVWHKYFSHLSVAHDCRHHLTDLHANPLKVLGSVQISFQLGRENITDRFIIVKGMKLSTHLLMGYPSMAQHNISLNPHEGVIRLHDIEIPHLETNSNITRQNSLKISAHSLAPGQQKTDFKVDTHSNARTHVQVPEMSSRSLSPSRANSPPLSQDTQYL